MLRLTLLGARGRLGTFTGALVALIASAVLVMAGAMNLEAALRAHPPVERYAAAGAARRPLDRRPRLGECEAHPVRADRGTRARRARRGRHRLPREARHAAA